MTIKNQCLVMVCAFFALQFLFINNTNAQKIEVPEEKVEPLFASNYFIGNSAFGEKKGTWKFKNIYILYNDFEGALTDNISIGVGLVPFGSIGDDSDVALPFFTRLKYHNSLNSKIHYSAKVGGYFANGGAAGSFAGRFTFGDRRSNFTVGYEHFFANGESGGLFELGGITPISEKTSVMVEAYIGRNIIDGDVVPSIVGFRTNWGKVALDYGLIVAMDWSSMDGVYWPFIGLNVKL